jgi:hypothetical protein
MPATMRSANTIKNVLQGILLLGDRSEDSIEQANPTNTN